MTQFLAAPIRQGPTAYISLLDPADSSRNFGRSGREPYVYLNLIRLWPNYDIIRQQIRITDLAAPNASEEQDGLGTHAGPGRQYFVGAGSNYHDGLTAQIGGAE